MQVNDEYISSCIDNHDEELQFVEAYGSFEIEELMVSEMQLVATQPPIKNRLSLEGS
jgi:hypothetical protein